LLGLTLLCSLAQTRTPLQEMSSSGKKAQAVINGPEKPVNDHLPKLFVAGSADREHWIAELLEWINEMTEIRLKPDHRSKSFCFRIMFDEPFRGAEPENIARRVRRICAARIRGAPGGRSQYLGGAATVVSRNIRGDLLQGRVHRAD
jgi:hypothetical protein